MEIKVTATPMTSWIDVLNKARDTQGKPRLPKDHEVSEKFKFEMLRLEESPLRSYIWDIKIEGLPSYTSTHLVRHKFGVEHYVGTSRPDCVDAKPRDEQLKIDPCSHSMTINAAEILQISRMRLCTGAEVETRKVWRAVVRAIEEVDHILAKYCEPQCVLYGFCRSRKKCGYEHSFGAEIVRNGLYLEK